MSNSIEQIRQEIRERLEALYGTEGEATTKMVMNSYNMAPMKDQLSYWEMILTTVTAQTEHVYQAAQELKKNSFGDFVCKEEDGRFVITKYIGKDKQVVIPGELNGIAVTGIGEEAFYELELTAVTIPDSVTFIGKSAFEYNKIEHLTFGSGIVTIEDKAFGENNLSGALVLPASVKTIGYKAFMYNKELTDAVVPDEVDMDKVAFDKKVKVVAASGGDYKAPSIKAAEPPPVVILAPVTLNGILCCANCASKVDVKKLFCYTCGTALALPDYENARGNKTMLQQDYNAEKQKVEKKTKEYADQLQKDGDWIYKTINDTVIVTGYVGSAAAVSIPSLIQGKPVTEIGEKTFYERGLTSVSFPDSVKSIGEGAFSGNKLTTINIPGTVETVGRSAFSSNDLESIVIGDGVKTIGESAFEQRSNFNEDRSKIANVIIPASITKIGEKAFFASRIASITLSKGVQSIGEEAFMRNQLKNLVIPEGVTEIGKSAFDENFIESLSLPDSLTKIGEAAFVRSRLTSLTIPPGLTKLGEAAFAGNKITAINIPASLTSIGKKAFFENKLQELTIPATLAKITESAFEKNELTRLTISDGVTSIGKRAFYGNKLTNLIVPASLTGLGEEAFHSNQLSGNITFPENLQKIEESAFAKNQFTGVEILGNTKIDDMAFSGNQISKIIINKRVPSIGDAAFEGNKPLVGVTIPEGIKIAMYAFKSNVYITRGETEGIKFDDTKYWQNFEQMIKDDRAKKAPKKPITFHGTSGENIGSVNFLSGTEDLYYNQYGYRGKRQDGFIFKKGVESFVGRIFVEADYTYSNVTEHFGFFTKDRGDVYQYTEIVTKEGIVLTTINKKIVQTDDKVSPTMGTIIKSAPKEELEQYRIGHVKAEGDVGVAYNKAGVKVGEVRNAGEFASVYAAAILMYLVN
ncbi:MAG: leucine-rich repeat domain-containing protein [Treponema sp.]|jgi:hypothetical protein|nr:leucine-rich repeat domain-containing protein [Treponema sp.]